MFFLGLFVFVFKFQMLLLGRCKEMDEFSVVSFRLMALKSYHSGIRLKGNSHPYICTRQTQNKQQHPSWSCVRYVYKELWLQEGVSLQPTLILVPNTQVSICWLNESKSGYRVNARNSQNSGKKQSISRSQLGTWAKDMWTRINILKLTN